MVLRSEGVFFKYLFLSLFFFQVNSFSLHTSPLKNFVTSDPSSFRSRTSLLVSPQTSSNSFPSPVDNIGLATVESLENVHNTVLVRADGKEFRFEDLLVNEKDRKNGISIVVFLRHFG